MFLFRRTATEMKRENCRFVNKKTTKADLLGTAERLGTEDGGGGRWSK